jgi:hypothetical protein
MKGQLSAVSEKYNALVMRHMQYKSKRKAQVEDLRFVLCNLCVECTGVMFEQNDWL